MLILCHFTHLPYPSVSSSLDHDKRRKSFSSILARSNPNCLLLIAPICRSWTKSINGMYLTHSYWHPYVQIWIIHKLIWCFQILRKSRFNVTKLIRLGSNVSLHNHQHVTISVHFVHFGINSLRTIWHTDQRALRKSLLRIESSNCGNFVLTYRGIFRRAGLSGVSTHDNEPSIRYCCRCF